jgi:cytoskeletal protein CcmA (bactofilin family)
VIHPKKIRASAMQLAILVSTIIAILLGSFLTLSQTHLFFNTQSKILLNVIDSTNAGIEYSLDADHKISDSIAIQSDIYSTEIKKTSWGGYLIIISTASVKTKSFSKTALIGGKVTQPALGVYLSEEKLPLVLVGNAKIEGDAYLSDLGIKPGIISGHYFNGKELVRGNISTGKGALPELDPAWLENIESLQKYIPSNLDIVIQRDAINKNSFFENTQYIYENNAITLKETYIGNIVIKSDTEVIISQDAHLTDVIVIAPKITIQKGFEGSAQFISEEKITLGENVRLTYPSSLIVLYDKDEEGKPVPKGKEPIFIADNSSIEGTVIYLDERKDKKDNRMNSVTNVSIAPQGTINGNVYCQGNVELMGTVVGAVFTNRFVAREFGSVYINHIYNGKILGRDIEPEFGGLPFKNGNKTIVKWLY